MQLVTLNGYIFMNQYYPIILVLIIMGYTANLLETKQWRGMIFSQGFGTTGLKGKVRSSKRRLALTGSQGHTRHRDTAPFGFIVDGDRYWHQRPNLDGNRRVAGIGIALAQGIFLTHRCMAVKS